MPARPLVPYRDFLVEYPPAFFLFALPPALVAHGVDTYATLFAALMGVLLTAALALLADVVRKIAPGAVGERSSVLVVYAAASALAIGPVLIRRYDPVVSLSLALVVWGCITKRAWGLGLGLGLGIAAKGMPLLLVPLLFAYLLAENRAS